MYKTTIFAALAQALLLVAPVLGQFDITCNSAGAIASCASHINAFCTTASSQTLPSSGAISRCFTLADGQQCEFTALNTQDNSKSTPSLDNCENGLEQVEVECARGGSSQRIQADGGLAPVRFFVNPNAGACT